MKNTILISLFLLPLLSCEKEVTLDNIPNHTPELFIESILVPGENPKVHLSNSQAFFNDRVTPQETFVRNATVELSVDNEIFTLLADSTFDKFRCRWTPFYTVNTTILHGKEYDLSVTYNGTTYIANTLIDQPKVNLNDVGYIGEFFDVYGGHDGVILRFKDPVGEGNFYRFQMDRIIDNSRLHAHVLEVVPTKDCTSPGELFFVRDLGRTIFNDLGGDGQDLELYVEVSFEYLEGDTTYIYLQSLDARSAAFYDDLDNQLQSILNPFVEPTFLHSTIEGTLGVFGSVVKSDPFLFIYPQDNP